ncbi:transmembrane and ubiquitin-like domain-containing protein 1 isoform X1 [Hyposmocoma kahamanoa]|uniref:transmembrane and ubiquitin-like domain-containing protein 1 isoform X1 n=1 Tax=Hyposmocoma kahamanoa TaxID=1477025 RepID=UPI000E6D63D6|nr:transmembrane and ubiquitin-like domain-containing protein 1 isoform X1 [Hyposmocoma kahamanoa]
MTLIEGVGDEVVQFVAVVLIILVAALAWWSTNANPDRYRTVLVMRSRAHHPVTVSIRTRSNLMITSTQNIQASPSGIIGGNASESTDEAHREHARVIPLQEMDSIVDADMAMLDNNRLHFYRRIDSPNTIQTVLESPNEENENQEETEPASNDQIREMDSIVSAMEADVPTTCDLFSRPSIEANTSSSAEKDKTESKNSSTSPDKEENDVVTSDAGQGTSADAEGDGDRRKILIKLKYLNDTLKEVEGSLDEMLKDFKWRHFSTELSAECRVRLIFNGRPLADDSATLRACGLHHRAVVHCLVHPKSNQNNQPQNGPEEGMGVTHELITEGAPPERAWDLENILMTLVSVALTVVWFFRCEYSNMFTASASVALFGLTVFYSVAIFGLYLSDTFHFERRAAPVPAQDPPVPNN